MANKLGSDPVNCLPMKRIGAILPCGISTFALKISEYRWVIGSFT